MAFDYINEAFKKLDVLEEQMFNTTFDGVKALNDFVDMEDTTDEVVRVIDPEATTEEDIEDSYVGKVIVNCNVCHSHVFENKEDIKIEEDGTVNIDTNCPYCGESEGFTIVGEIAPFAETKVEVDEKDLKDTIEEELSNQSFSRATRRMFEDFKEVSITTDDQHMEMSSDENGKVTITTEPVEKCSEETETGEVIVPVSDETEAAILADADVVDEEPAEEDTVIEDTPEIEATADDATEEAVKSVDIEEVDEEGLDELGEAYLRRVYENVESFKTTSIAANDHALVVEGLITFNSGAKKNTGFIFEARDINSKSRVRFNGSNKHFSEAVDAFSLVGSVDNKKLFVESLKYNYKVNDTCVRGIVRRK